MDRDTGVADLHMHTTASDGTCSVAERVTQAQDAGLETVAITDHDVISATLSDRVTDREGVEVITGVEVRGDVRETKVEILGYYVDPADEYFQSVLRQAREFREERNREMIAHLNADTALETTYEEIATEVRGMVGRPHMAKSLVDAGIVDRVDQAFDEYLASGGSAYIPMERIDAAEVVNAIQRAGGVAALAHPGRIRSTDVRAIVNMLADAGLDAIEVQYPYAQTHSDEAYADVTAEEAADIATTCDLLETGGSDCHGPESGKFRLGDVRVDDETVDALRQQAANRSPL